MALQLSRFFRALPLLALVAFTIPTAAATQSGQVDVAALRTPPYVEVPGRMEFSGVVLARPLQPSSAQSAGLEPGEVRERAAAAAALARTYALVRYVPETDEYLLRVPEGSSENQVAFDLLAGGNFEYVEPDWIVYPIGCTSDPLLGSQWHHDVDKMQSCAAWAIGTGDPSVVVAVCDTGVRTTHEDLQLHRQEGFNAPDNLWESNGGQINDINGHGTRTTGCAAANGDNGLGVSGVGWNTAHRMMRVTNSSGGSASLSDITLAARTAADAGDRVASVSYSGVTSNGVQTAGQYLNDRDAWLVWAAGNENSQLNGNRDDAVIVVGATDQSDQRASFSNYGSFVDLFAPGVDVFSTTNSGNSSYGGASGTSFACPLSAGLVALIWSLDPTLTPAAAEDVLRQGCDDLGAPGEDAIFGFGRINSFQSADLARPAILITFPNGRPEFVDPAGGTALTVAVAPGSDSAVSGSGRLFVVIAGNTTELPLIETSPGTHEGSFPPAPCGATVDWYVTFDLTGGGTQSSPSGAPAETYQAQAWLVTAVLNEDFETDSGWTAGAPGDNATTGLWVRVDPNGTAAQPEDDHTPAPGVTCWVTGQGSAGGSLGENDVDGGTTTLVSPVFDMSSLSNPLVRYWRWYSNDTGAAPNSDVFVIDVSNDGGGNWINVETIGPAGPGTGGGWIEHEFFVSDVIAPTAQMRVRFVASDLGSGSIVEAAVDDFGVFDYQCDCGATNYCTSTPNSSGLPGLIAAGGSFVVGDNDLQLSASQLPPGQFGIFYYGPNQVQIPFGNGFRCVGGSVFRLPVLTIDSQGSAAFSPDLTNLPPGGDITPGSTWNFQFWFRDPPAGGAGFDLTDGVEVRFCP